MESDDAPKVAGEGMHLFVPLQHLKQELVVPIVAKPIFCTAFGLINAARGVELGHFGVGVQPCVLIRVHCSLRGKLRTSCTNLPRRGGMWRGRLEAKGKKLNKKGKLSEGMTRT
jgi:hypothetical protein